MTDTIDQRLQLIYAALGIVVETDIQSAVKFVQEGSTSRMTFDKDMNALDIENNAHMAISLMAHFPDHLKRWLRSSGLAITELEQFMLSCQEIKVLKDLANTEKHGGFDRNGGHSGLLPRLANVHRGMRLEPKPDGSQATIKINLPEGTITHVNGNPLQVVIDADVMDSNGNKLCSLAWLLESSLDQLETLHGRLAAV